MPVRVAEGSPVCAKKGRKSEQSCESLGNHSSRIDLGAKSRLVKWNFLPVDCKRMRMTGGECLWPRWRPPRKSQKYPAKQIHAGASQFSGGAASSPRKTRHSKAKHIIAHERAQAIGQRRVEGFRSFVNGCAWRTGCASVVRRQPRVSFDREPSSPFDPLLQDLGLPMPGNQLACPRNVHPTARDCQFSVGVCFARLGRGVRVALV